MKTEIKKLVANLKKRKKDAHRANMETYDDVAYVSGQHSGKYIVYEFCISELENILKKEKKDLVPICNTNKSCKYIQHNHVCGYNGFCNYKKLTKQEE